ALAIVGGVRRWTGVNIHGKRRGPRAGIQRSADRHVRAGDHSITASVPAMQVKFIRLAIPVKAFAPGWYFRLESTRRFRIGQLHHALDRGGSRPLRPRGTPVLAPRPDAARPNGPRRNSCPDLGQRTYARFVLGD